MRLITIILFILFVFVSSVQGADHYFDVDAVDDSGAGTIGDPWKTLAKAQTECGVGDTCYFDNTDTWTCASPPCIEIATGATLDGASWGAGTRATFQATGDGDELGMVLIYVDDITFKGFKVDGNDNSIGQIYIGYRDAAGDVDNIEIDNCEVTNNRTTDVGSQFYYGIIIGQRFSHTTSNVTVKNSEIHHTGHEGITIYPSATAVNNTNNIILIRNNIVHHTGLVTGTNRGNTIDVGNDSDNVTIEFNTIYDTGALSSGIAVVAYSTSAGLGTPDNIIIRYNLLYNESAIEFIPGTEDGIGSVYVYGNILINSQIAFSTGDYAAADILIYNNTIYRSDNADYALRFNGLSGSTGTLEIKNNIFQTGDFVTVRDSVGNAYTHVTHTNNQYYRSSGAAATVISIVGDTDYIRSGVTTFEVSAQSTDPTFTGGTLPTGFSGTYGSNMVPNTTYFSINSGDALDNGVTLGSPYNGCINGAGLSPVILRPQSTAYDIGAYEYDPSTESISMKAGTTGQIKAGTTGSFGN